MGNVKWQQNIFQVEMKRGISVCKDSLKAKVGKCDNIVIIRSYLL